MAKQNPLDRENLRQVILESHKQFAEGLRLAQAVRVKGNFTSLEISGMGGSSLPANILRVYLNSLYLENPKKNKKFGIFQNRSYSLPHEAYTDCLNFFASYSGNTEETIASLKEAIRAKLPSVGFGTGGQLQALCRKNGIPCINLPAGIQPRYATGYFFAAMFQVLVNAGMVEDKTHELVKLAKRLEKEAAKLESRGKQIARKLVGKTPIIYATPKYKSLAMIWKIKINENAKTPAFYNFYPELNHNEMVGFTLPQSKFHVITLMDKKTHPQIIKRMKITARLLKKKGYRYDFCRNGKLRHFLHDFRNLAPWRLGFLLSGARLQSRPDSGPDGRRPEKTIGLNKAFYRIFTLIGLTNHPKPSILPRYTILLPKRPTNPYLVFFLRRTRLIAIFTAITLFYFYINQI